MGAGLGAGRRAGSFVDPTGAHGIRSALRDSELLARAVVAVHAGVAAERLDLPTAAPRAA